MRDKLYSSGEESDKEDILRMKTYELVFEEKQPTCGGKSPVNTSISMVTIEDPLEYVKAKEPGAECTMTTEGDTIIIEVKRVRDMWARYEFTED